MATSTKKVEPFNIMLLDNNRNRLNGLLPVQSMDILDTDGNYHPQGLYSSEIFGKPGEKSRLTRHGYIDMRTEVLHPKIYLELSRLKNLYGGILAGTAYAIWNDKIKDFEKSDIIDGQTGYSFFMSHFNDIVFARNESSIREQRIMLIEKYRPKALYRYLVVLGAGLRDIETEADGRMVEDEINKFYRKIMGVANTIAVRSNNSNDPMLDTVRWSLQQTFNEIYHYIESILEGKRGFLLSKWGTRVIHGGTRNVITAMDPAPAVLGGPNALSVNDTIIGLHQYLKSTVDLSIYGLKTGPFGDVIGVLPGIIPLVNMKTLESELVTPSPKTKERWGTMDGLEGLINGYEEVKVRKKPVIIEDHYLALIYEDDQYFKIFKSIEELPNGFDRNKVRPVNWTDVYYYSVFWQSKEPVNFVTRYPIAGPGSIYACNSYLRITTEGLIREELTEDWKPSGKIWYEVPNYNGAFFDSMSVHPSKIKGLTAD